MTLVKKLNRECKYTVFTKKGSPVNIIANASNLKEVAQRKKDIVTHANNLGYDVDVIFVKNLPTVPGY